MEKQIHEYVEEINEETNTIKKKNLMVEYLKKFETELLVSSNAETNDRILHHYVNKAYKELKKKFIERYNNPYKF